MTYKNPKELKKLQKQIRKKRKILRQKLEEQKSQQIHELQKSQQQTPTSRTQIEQMSPESHMFPRLSILHRMWSKN